MCHRFILAQLLCCVVVSASSAQDLWLTKAHDGRRTGQSQNLGPVSIDEGQSWVAEAPGGIVLNVGASVDADGAYIGSWGLLRRNPNNPDRRTWDKSDGKLFGYSIGSGAPVWAEHAALDLVPRCYDFMNRGPNLGWCGVDPYEVSFYNGTVEGQAAIDLSRNVIYAGRGDGRLYALDRDTGQINWRYVTFNPQLPADPDGGGEIISSPLIGPAGNIYFGTWGEGDYETNAVYAIDPNGNLIWRYPNNASLTHRIFASAALSPDGSTLYLSTFRDDTGQLPGSLYALNRNPTAPATDADRLKWKIDFELDNLAVQTATIAVGTDGTVYVGGLKPFIFGVPILTAIQDLGDHAEFKWNPNWVQFADGAQYTLGVSLREEAGETKRLFVTTANLGTAIFNGKVEGTLYAINPATGAIEASYDPSDDVPEAVGGLNSPAIDAAGRIYFGVRGRFGANPINGHFFAVSYNEATTSFNKLWNYEVDGYIEWNHPAIGPDGGIYVGSSENEDSDATRLGTYDDGLIPEKTTPKFYALKGPSVPVSVEMGEVPENLINHVSLYPNPSFSYATVGFEVGSPGFVLAEMWDMLGRRISVLHDGPLQAGRQRLQWNGDWGDGHRAAPGVYVLTIRWLDSIDRIGSIHTQKLVVLPH